MMTSMAGEILVIGWRRDGKVDVYHEAGLKLRPEKYDIAGKGLEQMIKTGMTGLTSK